MEETFTSRLDSRMKKERVVTRRLVKPRLEVKYPHVEGLANRFVQKMVNTAIIDLVYDLIRMQGYMQDPAKTITGTYEVKLHKNGILSVVLDNYGYAKGAAHGITYRKSLTFNLEDGAVYKLADLFKYDSGYRTRISDMIKRQIKEKDVPLIAEFVKIVENQDFYLTDHAVVVYFQLYEYTPYAYGFPEFIIPFRELASIIDPGGPLGRLT